MPYILSKHREEFLEIKVTGTLYDRAHKSNWFDASYLVEDAEGQKYIRPGLVVAQNTSSYKWVPYNVSASYGPGSDGVSSILGVLDTFEILTLGEEAIDPITHGTLIESHCYIFGGALGTISAAVKTALPDIQWV